MTCFLSFVPFVLRRSRHPRIERRGDDCARAPGRKLRKCLLARLYGQSPEQSMDDEWKFGDFSLNE
jgi:hypothetical protein